MDSPSTVSTVTDTPPSSMMMVPAQDTLAGVPCIPWSSALQILREGPGSIQIPEYLARLDDPILAVYSREDWGAMPTTQVRPTRRPVANVRFTHTGRESRYCKEPDKCFEILRDLQRDHIGKDNLPDINFNFLIGMDGSIYEGRGWGVDVDRPKELEHLGGNCVDIAFIGDWIVNGVPPGMVTAGYSFVIHGNEKGHIMKKPNVLHSVEDVVELHKAFRRFQDTL